MALLGWAVTCLWLVALGVPTHGIPFLSLPTRTKLLHQPQQLQPNFIFILGEDETRLLTDLRDLPLVWKHLAVREDGLYSTTVLSSFIDHAFRINKPLLITTPSVSSNGGAIKGVAELPHGNGVAEPQRKPEPQELRRKRRVVRNRQLHPKEFSDVMDVSSAPHFQPISSDKTTISPGVITSLVERIVQRLETLNPKTPTYIIYCADPHHRTPSGASGQERYTQEVHVLEVITGSEASLTRTDGVIASHTTLPFALRKIFRIQKRQVDEGEPASVGSPRCVESDLDNEASIASYQICSALMLIRNPYDATQLSVIADGVKLFIFLIVALSLYSFWAQHRRRSQRHQVLPLSTDLYDIMEE